MDRANGGIVVVGVVGDVAWVGEDVMNCHIVALDGGVRFLLRLVGFAVKGEVTVVLVGFVPVDDIGGRWRTVQAGV